MVLYQDTHSVMVFIASLSCRFPAIYNTAFVYWYPSLVQQADEYQQIFRQRGGEHRETYQSEGVF